MVSPVIAVVVPMLNAAGDLDELFTTLFDQDFDQPWELIAVDNGSEDDTADRARSLLRSSAPANLVRAEVVEASPRGYATPRNAGVAATTAPLLAFCDADGAVDRRWLTEITSALGRHPLVASRKYRTVDVSDRRPESAQAELREVSIILGVRFAETGGLGCTRELFEALGGFDPYFDYGGEDTDFSFRARFRLGVEPVMEQDAIYWTSVSTQPRRAFTKGHRDARTQVRLYRRHADQHLPSPRGVRAIVRSLRRLQWRLRRLRPGQPLRRAELAREVGFLLGLMGWSATGDVPTDASTRSPVEGPGRPTSR